MPNQGDSNDIDPFDAEKNPIGTQGLTPGYLVAANSVMLGQSYSSLVASQMSLDVTAVDVGLAVKVTAYQRQLQGHAGYVLNNLSSDFIRLVVDGNNLATLIEAFVQLERAAIAGSFTDADVRRTLGLSIGALGEDAGQAFVDAGTLVDHVTVTSQALETISKGLDTAIDTTLADLDASMKATSKSIDTLTEAIYKNINDIVSGANASGDAVKDLGLGLLTMFSGEIKEPDAKPKPDGDKPAGDGGKKPEGDAGKTETAAVDPKKEKLAAVDPKKEKPAAVDPKKEPAGKTPSVEFVVTAIRAGSSGVEKWSAAQKALESNNEMLSKAYQSLAQQSAMLAVAKVVQAQKDLLVTCVGALLADVTQLKLRWAAVRAGLKGYGNSLEAVPDQAAALQLASIALGAKTLWSACRAELLGVKQSMTAVGQGGLARV